MKIVHINRPQIRQDNDRKLLAELMRARMQRNARQWAEKKYAAQLKGGTENKSQ